MFSPKGLPDDLNAGAASLSEAAATLALIATEMAQGFTASKRSILTHFG